MLIRILKALLLPFVTLLTAIGDVTIFFGSLLWKMLVFVPRTTSSLTHHMQFSLPVHKKRKKKVKTLVRIRSSVGFKLRYFIFGTLFSFCFIFLPVIIFVIIKTLPDPTILSQQQFPQTTKIYDRNHVLLYQFYANQNRTLVHLRDIPLYLREATVAIEDKNFYQNPGFDVIAIARAAISDLKHQGFQGGSTITQQLMKSTLLTSEQTVNRKLQEIALAFWTERLYSKDKILEMYLNVVPYGGTAWGVETASQTYFGKDVKDLDLAECAFLAGLPQAPSQYSPFGSNPTLWKARQKEVLRRMKDLGYIDATQESQALSEQLTFQSQPTPLLAPHFVMFVKDYLIQKYGLALVEKGGLTVTTTLDLATQNMAQKIVSQEVSKDGYLNLTNGAAVITNPQNGDILAMVGSIDYNNPDFGAVNIATSLRQPGSSIKVVTYAAALSHGYTPATIINDSPVAYTNAWETYAPVNYDGRFHGNVTLRTSLANSFNIPAVKTLASIGIPMFVDYGHKMGISHLQSADHYGLSVTLGAAEVTMIDMATAYGTLANYGNRVDLNPILEADDYKGNILEKKTPTSGVPVVDPGVTYQLDSILSDNNARTLEFGPTSPLYFPGISIPVKTGTTDDKRDNWTDGYTKDRVVVVWVGNNDNSPMSPGLASGITGAAPIWHQIMSNLIGNKKGDIFTPPADIVSKPCNGRTEYFVKGTENNVTCMNYPTWTPAPQPTQTQ